MMVELLRQACSIQNFFLFNFVLEKSSKKSFLPEKNFLSSVEAAKFNLCPQEAFRKQKITFQNSHLYERRLPYVCPLHSIILKSHNKLNRVYYLCPSRQLRETKAKTIQMHELGTKVNYFCLWLWYDCAKSQNNRPKKAWNKGQRLTYLGHWPLLQLKKPTLIGLQQRWKKQLFGDKHWQDLAVSSHLLGQT